MKRSIILSLVLAVSICSLVAGPFGLEFGWSLDDLMNSDTQFISPTREEIEEYRKEYPPEEDLDFYLWNTIFEIIPPNPSDIFPFYNVGLSFELGLYAIEAYEGNSIIYDNYEPIGFDDNYAIPEYIANQKFDKTYNALIAKYGKDAFYDSWYSMNTKYWNQEDNKEHLDIKLSKYQSSTAGDFKAFFNNYTEALRQGTKYDELEKIDLYYISLEYSKEDYLQALKDAEFF